MTEQRCDMSELLHRYKATEPLCPNCERVGRLNPVHPGALNLQCNWCWAIIDPAGKIVMLHR